MAAEPRLAWACCLLQAMVGMAMVASAQAQAQAPAGAVDADADCSDTIHSLTECVPYVTGRSPSPTPECCQRTALVYERSPRCLCMVLRSSADRGLISIPVNLTLAVRVPVLCHIAGADIDNCPEYLSLTPDDPDVQFYHAVNSTAPAGLPSSGAASKGVGRRGTLAWFFAGSVAVTVLPIMWASLY